MRLIIIFGAFFGIFLIVSLCAVFVFSCEKIKFYPERGFQSAWWYQILIFSVMIGFGAAAGFMKTGENDMVSNIIECCFIIPCAAGYYALKRSDRELSLRELGFCGIKREYIPYVLFIPMFYQIFCIYMTMPLTLLLNALFGSDLPDITVPKDAAGVISTLTGICILAPLFEEFLYRGIMVRLLKGCSFRTIMLTTSLAFAMMHMDMSGFTQIFFLGMLLFIIRTATGSLFSSVAAHSVINLMSFILSVLSEKNMITEYESIILAVDIGSLIVVPFLMVNFLRVTVSEDDWTKKFIIKGKKKGISVGCIIFTVIYIIWNGVVLSNNISSGYTQKTLGEFFDTVTAEEETA
ncbi:MAG: CPBP family intramembrane metalloprotease [Oscillospiraceae bacterium]|nr:CPBP family intramembrane metalloprotease [Oscillospiraceae bacterium]